MKYLYENGANVTITDKNGEIALTYARQKGQDDIISYLFGRSITFGEPLTIDELSAKFARNSLIEKLKDAISQESAADDSNSS